MNTSKPNIYSPGHASMRNKSPECGVCGRQIRDAYVCRRCANELRDLLIGSRTVGGQPGITWYVRRLRESAYGQTRMARSLSAKSTSSGYALLGDKRAYDLLGRINSELAVWEGTVEALRATHSHETGFLHTGSPTRDSERLETKRARYVAAHVTLLRHHHPSTHRLYAAMLGFGREGWRIINRPNDICCGPCPSLVYRAKPDSPYANSRDNVSPCGTMLYADEGDTAVACPRCGGRHDVQTLRNGLKTHVADMLFTRHELVTLMETRLNDRIPQPTFTKLLRDRRLQPRKIDDDGVALFTYDDVVEARLKPVPPKRIRKAG